MKGGGTIKILWVTNLIIGAIHVKIYGKESNGLWMDALLNDFISRGEHELVIVTTGNNKKSVFLEDGKVKYYVLPGGPPTVYNHKKANHIKEWESLISKECPDIIQVWGSEYKHGLAAIKAAPDVPSVIYMQGILATVARYYEAGIDHCELIKSTTLKDILSNGSILAKKRRFYINAEYEKEMLELSGNIISENLWCNVHCKAIADNVKTHYCPLSINEVFRNYSWPDENMERHSVMTSAAVYPLKGLHMVLKAICLVKKKYPDVKLYVPGISLFGNKSMIKRILKSGYTKYIEKLISKLGIQDNVCFTGSLTADSMAAKMASVNVYVMGSALENHSSTLKEAMQVGTPCISSIVGGVPEYALHGENALLYRFEEYELLAEYIMNIFENRELADRISCNARAAMSALNNNVHIYETILSIYNKVIESSSGDTKRI